ncbi:hypothetical protein A2U01_0119521, partial [Trifolium medium]|nr:hypothetical protein [Trifolium medium]
DHFFLRLAPDLLTGSDVGELKMLL